MGSRSKATHQPSMPSMANGIGGTCVSRPWTRETGFHEREHGWSSTGRHKDSDRLGEVYVGAPRPLGAWMGCDRWKASPPQRAQRGGGLVERVLVHERCTVSVAVSVVTGAHQVDSATSGASCVGGACDAVSVCSL